MNNTQNLTPQQLYQLGYDHYWGTKNHAVDYTQAAKYFRMAADAGNADAQYYLATCYVDERGVEKDLQEAIRLYIRAAQQGHKNAQFNLAWSYEQAQGVDQDLKQAAYWYQRAAEQGHIHAQYYLALIYYYAKGLLTPNYEDAFRWFHAAAKQGHAKSQYMTAVCYTDEKGISRDYEASIDWYIKAAEQGHVQSQFNLGWCYEQAQGVERDLTQAAYWYQKAAENGHQLAPYYLAMCSIALQDHETAVHWLTIAADNGNTDAAQFLQQELEAMKADSSSSQIISAEQTADQLLSTLEDARLEMVTQPIRRGYYAQVKVIVHGSQDADRVQQEAERLAVPSNKSSGSHITLNRSIKLEAHLDSPDVTIEEPIETLYWNGRYSDCSFIIEVPADFPKSQIRLTARIYYKQSLLQKIPMIIDISDSSHTYHPNDQKSGTSAFISYAHEDLEKVTGRIQGMLIRDPDYNLFLDIKDMKKSERFEPRLYAEIEKRDLFYLFWSRNAAASDWVAKELEHALKTKGKDAIELIPLELPDICPPPKGLEDLNASNILLYLVNHKSNPSKSP